VRAAGAADLAPRLLEFGVPVMASWQAKDLVDNDHPNYFGCPGIYGNRSANAALYAADMILAIGNRLSIWNVGYDGPRKDQHVVMVDVDGARSEKHAGAVWINEDAGAFIRRDLLYGERPGAVVDPRSLRRSNPPRTTTRTDLSTPTVSSTAAAALEGEDEVVTIDCGSACASAFQAFHVKPPQRLISSGGLGEMGCALPYAVGASFARGKRDVIAIVGDGAMMLNLQELQTIVHHQLPVKIIVCRNDVLPHDPKDAGERRHAIRRRQRLDRRLQSSLPAARVRLRDHRAASVTTWSDFETAVPAFLAHEGPALIEYHMDPRAGDRAEARLRRPGREPPLRALRPDAPAPKGGIPDDQRNRGSRDVSRRSAHSSAGAGAPAARAHAAREHGARCARGEEPDGRRLEAPQDDDDPTKGFPMTDFDYESTSQIGSRELTLDGTNIGYHRERVEAWARGERVAPIFMDVAFTRKCQAACYFCAAQTQASDGGVITREHAMSFLEDAAEIGVLAMNYISDGESTMVPWYADAVESGDRPRHADRRGHERHRDDPPGARARAAAPCLVPREFLGRREEALRRDHGAQAGGLRHRDREHPHGGASSCATTTGRA
jgi:hypothetical protein